MQKKKVLHNQEKTMQTLTQEKDVGMATMKKALKWGSSLLLIKKARGQTNHHQGRKKTSYESQETLHQGQTPSWPKNALVLRRQEFLPRPVAQSA